MFLIEVDGSRYFVLFLLSQELHRRNRAFYEIKVRAKANADAN